MSVDFIHLRVHSEFSLVDGIVKIKPLISHLTKLAMPAVALTEQSNLFSLVKFYRAAQKAGIKPIIGADIYLENDIDRTAPFRMTLLAQNHSGYMSLSVLISRAYQEGQLQGVPIIKSEWLQSLSEGLIVLSGAQEGDIGQALMAGNDELAERLAQHWQAVFPNRFYLEIQRIGKSEEENYIAHVLILGAKFSLPVVATNNVRFLSKEEFNSHEIRVCINQGRVLDDNRRPKDYTPQQYLRSTEEMIELFADIPEALENTVEIAKRCNLELTLGKSFLPDFPVPKGLTLDEHFIALSNQGLSARFKRIFPENSEVSREHSLVYQKRLDDELAVIIEMGFPGYFLIVADFIQWAKDNGIPVGPGRGSGAGSLVAYVLNITDLDPIEFDLLFERFLNPERISMPDFDVDFCMDRRDEVIAYVAQRYGRDHVSQIITYGTMAAKAVVRDVGRVMGHGYGFVDHLAKLIPFELGMTLTKALADSEPLRELYQTDEEVKSLIDYGLSLEGTARNAGKHAGGVVISPTPLTDFTPLYCEQGGGNLVTQFDKDDVESVGLVKFDFLGLRTLTIIDWAIQAINQTRSQLGLEVLDIAELPFGDLDTYELLKRGQTTAVFQLESRGMKELIKKLQPDCFDDIIALVALFRPGPLESGMVDDYINVKHGAKVEYAHATLEPILGATNGVILYQEQVMQIARELAGYTLGGADILRRAMGKKKVEEMAEQRSIFTQGAVSNNIDKDVASYIFDLMEKFAGYGFNKSHSAAYALIAYQTAWLKAHYPAIFMASVLSSDMDNTDKVVQLVEECRDMKLELLQPDINRSNYRFGHDSEGMIVYGLGAIKGVGQSAIEALLEEREVNGPFKGLFDLCQRVDLRRINKRVLEALAKSGAFDSFGSHRAAYIENQAIALKSAEQFQKMQRTGQNDLFGLVADVPAMSELGGQKEVEPWPEDERLMAEKQVLGYYLTGHPIHQYREELTHITHANIASLQGKVKQAHGKVVARVAGLVTELRTRQTRKGKMIAFAVIDDCTGRLEIAAFTTVYEQCRPLLEVDQIVVAEGGLAVDDYSGMLRVTIETLYSIDGARAEFSRRLVLTWVGDFSAEAVLGQLDNLAADIQPFRGGRCPVVIAYKTRTIVGADNARCQLQLGDDWRLSPTDAVLKLLEKTELFDSVTVEY
ncbi:MAG: DNA polymerase III subunit alpha [Methylococcales bacterium]|jgi:DNA polymerase-3 subunit alpha|nr:DNA polymerase III subunit alpha [Methylococcales bacterium]